jgi:hypothetical protein
MPATGIIHTRWAALSPEFADALEHPVVGDVLTGPERLGVQGRDQRRGLSPDGGEDHLVEGVVHCAGF